MSRTWLIAGASSRFGYEMTKQLLEAGDTVIGTIRNVKRVEELIAEYPVQFGCKILDVTNVPAIHRLVEEVFAQHGRIDVMTSDIGCGLFGCAEELSDEEINHIIAANLTGSIMLIRNSLPHLRTQEGGRTIQMSTYGGQAAYAANSIYHATKFGIKGFYEAVAQGIAQFYIDVTLVEPGGTRMEFRYDSAKVAKLMPEYESHHDFLSILDTSKGLALDDPIKMAKCIIESADKTPAPLRMVLDSQALKATIDKLEERVADYKTQTELATSTDIIWRNGRFVAL